ncbi:unnamed protein product [Echinostoma caproni]|uniref:Uncharacterized protein n=1 Tax=Echinostoma caproni TaxID=27848 RepID=A0A3P8G8T2_9TREM|nr:unnamed protein product [Echinostoma caproni]
MFPDSGQPQFIGRYAISVNRPIDIYALQESFARFSNVTQVESWAFWVSRGAMSEILFHSVQQNLSLFQRKQLLVYDGTADPDRCWTMCYPNVDGRTRCGYDSQNREVYCVKVDLKDADLRALGRIRAEVGAVWDDVGTEQVRLAILYCT